MPGALLMVLRDTYSVGGLHRLEFGDETFLSKEDVEMWLKEHSYNLDDEEAITRVGNRWVAVIRREGKFAEGSPRFEPLPLGAGVVAYVGKALQNERKPPARSTKPIEGGQVVPETVDLAEVLKSVPTAEMDESQLKEAQGERAGRFAIEPLDGATLKFAEGDPTDLETWGDPVNLRYPLSSSDQTTAALAAFEKEAGDYSRPRSQKIVFSRIVAKALEQGVPVDGSSELVTKLIAPDLKRKIAEQKKPTEKSATTAVMKLDLDEGMSLQDLMSLLCRAVEAVARAGTFGTYNTEYNYWPGCLVFVGESTLVVNNYQDARYYQASWSRKGSEITLTDIAEVRMVTSFEAVGTPDKDTKLVIREQVAKLDLADGSVENLMDKISGAVRAGSSAGLFGMQGEDYCTAYVRAVYDTTVVVSNYREGKLYQADWKREKGGAITLSDVKEVRMVETYQEVGPGPIGGSVTKDSPNLPAGGINRAAIKKEIDDLWADIAPAPTEDPIAEALAFIQKAAAPILENRFKTFKEGNGLVRVVPILKVNAPERTVTYEVYRPDERDTHGDWMSKETVYKAMAFWMAHSQEFDADHDFTLREAQVVENWQLKEDWVVDGETLPAGTWMQSTKIIDDALWKSIEEGDYNYVSVAGTARAVADSKPAAEKTAKAADAQRETAAKADAELTEMEVWKVSFVRRGANSAQGVAPFSIFKADDGLEERALASIFDTAQPAMAESRPGIFKRAWQYLTRSAGSKPDTSPRGALLKELEEALTTIEETHDMKLKDLTLFVKENYTKDPAGTLKALEELDAGLGILIEQMKASDKDAGQKMEKQASCGACGLKQASDAKFCSDCGGSMKQEKAKEEGTPAAGTTPAAAGAPTPTQPDAAAPAADLAKTVENAVKAATSPLLEKVTKLEKDQQALAVENAALKAQKDSAQQDAQKKAELLKEAGLGGAPVPTGANGGERTSTEKSENGSNPWAEVDNFRSRYVREEVRRQPALKDGERDGWDD